MPPGGNIFKRSNFALHILCEVRNSFNSLNCNKHECLSPAYKDGDKVKNRGKKQIKTGVPGKLESSDFRGGVRDIL